MRYVFGFFLALATTVPATAQTTIAGSWHGVLNFPQQTLHFVLHVSGTNDNLSATADSPDQGANGMPVDSITLSGQTLHFTMTKLDVNFTGTVSDGTISGTFIQRGVSVPLTLSKGDAGSGGSSSGNNSMGGVTGTWSGVLNFPQQTLHFVLHVSGTNDNLSATADSPDQGANGMPVDSITLSGQTLHFTMTKLDVNFTGTISGGTISGTFIQHGVSVSLTLSKP